MIIENEKLSSKLRQPTSPHEIVDLFWTCSQVGALSRPKEVLLLVGGGDVDGCPGPCASSVRADAGRDGRGRGTCECRSCVAVMTNSTRTLSSTGCREDRALQHLLEDVRRHVLELVGEVESVEGRARALVEGEQRLVADERWGHDVGGARSPRFDRTRPAPATAHRAGDWTVKVRPVSTSSTVHESSPNASSAEVQCLADVGVSVAVSEHEEDRERAGPGCSVELDVLDRSFAWRQVRVDPLENPVLVRGRTTTRPRPGTPRHGRGRRRGWRATSGTQRLRSSNWLAYSSPSATSRSSTC